MQKNARGHSTKTGLRARQLRSEMSVSEKTLWEILRKKKLGFRFNRQVRVHPYYLDFYCAEASLCIEVDGQQHCGRQAQDQARDEYLAKMGILTLQIPSVDLFERNSPVLSTWVETIQMLCEQRSQRPWGAPPPTPPPR
jgi:very-short-patch-repair endonuclease